MARSGEDDNKPRDDECRWGYWDSIKKVAIVMVILIVISLILSIFTDGLGYALGGLFANTILFVPVMIALIPTVFLVDLVYNSVVCHTL